MSDRVLLSPDWRAVADCVDAYESALESQSTFPSLGDFLESVEAEYRARALWELVKVDLEFHWRSGERRVVEDYLAEFPELGTRETVAVELVLAELETRFVYEPEVRFEEFFRRFPQYTEQIEIWLAQRGSESLIAPTMDGFTSNSEAGFSLNTDGSEMLRSEYLAPEHFPFHFGRYELIASLGGGGMGRVFLAVDSKLGRRIALKVPRFEKGDPPIVRERFLREARSAATLHHPNICPVHDVDEKDGILYLTMAYVEGQTLGQWLHGAGRAEPKHAARIVAKIASALEEAHRNGIIHRDLKPSNIMLDKRGEPILMDFGLARRQGKSDPKLTQSGSPLGTPAYMPPEQIEQASEVSGPGGDVYSLGVILYELLTGRVPFSGPSPGVFVKIALEEPVCPTELVPDLDPALEAICLKAMQKKIGARYPSAGELAETLLHYIRSGDDDKHSPMPDKVPASKSNWVETPSSSAPPWDSSSAEFVSADKLSPPRRHRRLVISLAASLLATLAVGALLLAPEIVFRNEKGANALPLASTSPEGRPRLGARDRRLPLLKIILQPSTESRDWIELSDGNGPVRKADRVQFHARLPKAAYAYLVWYNAEGKGVLLWPNDPERQVKVKEFWDPPQTPGAKVADWMEVDGNPGTEAVLLAISETPLSPAEIADFLGQSLPLRVTLDDDPLASTRVLAVVPEIPEETLRAPGRVVSSAKAALEVFDPSFENRLHHTFDSYTAIVFPLRP